jgi:peptide/nickel transport system permease protein
LTLALELVGRKLMTNAGKQRGLTTFGRKVSLLSNGEKFIFVLIILILVAAIFGESLAPYDPYYVNLKDTLLPPSADHWFGTDVNGRDLFSRILVGASSSLLSTLAVIVFAAVVGTIFGTLSALGPRWLDEIIMRFSDVAFAFPALILSLGFAAALGPSLRSAVIALALTWWPGYARLVRTFILEVKHREYVDAARVLGVSPSRLIFKHILPNALVNLYVQVTIDVSAVLLVISGLSFIGIGAQAPSAEWGALVADGRNYILAGWWTVVIPGAVICITAILFNLAGDALRIINDPTLVRKGEK